MNIIITDTPIEMSQTAAKMIADQIHKKPHSLLALSTGSTPVGTYQELIKLYQDQKVDFSDAKCLNMDEYMGFSNEQSQSYYYFMNHHLYRHTNFKSENLFGPCATETDSFKAAQEFDQKIENEGGIDLILLGIGRDGHIAFNMPSSKLNLKTHVQQLSEVTIQDNARFFEQLEDVPTRAITIGIENIFKSKKVVMIANGTNKAQIIKELIESPYLDPKIPATLLKLHSDFTLIIDQDAAKLLDR